MWTPQLRPRCYKCPKWEVMLGASNMVNTSCLTRDTRHKTKVTNGQ